MEVKGKSKAVPAYVWTILASMIQSGTLANFWHVTHHVELAGIPRLIAQVVTFLVTKFSTTSINAYAAINNFTAITWWPAYLATSGVKLALDQLTTVWHATQLDKWTLQTYVSAKAVLTKKVLSPKIADLFVMSLAWLAVFLQAIARAVILLWCEPTILQRILVNVSLSLITRGSLIAKPAITRAWHAKQVGFRTGVQFVTLQRIEFWMAEFVSAKTSFMIQEQIRSSAVLAMPNVWLAKHQVPTVWVAIRLGSKTQSPKCAIALIFMGKTVQ